jgi:hypothetical protein
MEILKDNSWSQTSQQIFWGEIAPCEHVVQIYENDDAFLDLLTGYISAGIDAGESVVIIATAHHLTSINQRLTSIGVPVTGLIASSQYIALDAEEMLSKFMVNGWPDENLFNHLISDVLTKAKSRGRKVRAFGEMVAILWAKGQVGATVRLEHLWNKFSENEAFALFCAYPKSGFTQDATESVMHICGAHSKMITSAGKGKTDIFYKAVHQRQGV